MSDTRTDERVDGETPPELAPSSEANAEQGRLLRRRHARHAAPPKLRDLGKAFAGPEEPPAGGWWRSHGHLVLVLGAVVYGLVALAPERLSVAYPNDSSVHILSVTTAAQELKAGHLPFASWFPDLAIGSPFFLHYQSTPAVLTAVLGRIIGVPGAFAWTLYLLFALLPLSIYWSGRLFGLGRYTSAIASAASLFIVSYAGYGVEQQSYDWLGSGMWTQLWGIWVLPLAWGATYRAISKREFRLLAVVLLGSTIAFHFLTAYLAGLSLLVFVLLRPTQILPRLWRAAVVGGGAAGLTLYVTIPLSVYGKWGADNEFQVNTFWNDSYGARQILRWLVTGRLYDNGRFPVITIFVGLGILVAALRWRRDEAARAVLGLWVLSLLLYFGRPTLGPIINLLPGNQSLLLHRYVMGVHLAGLLLGGIGAVGLGRAIAYLARRAARRMRGAPLISSGGGWWQPVVAILAVFLVLSPAWRQLWQRDQSNATAIASQRSLGAVEGAEVNALVAKTHQLGGGRIFAGLLADSWESSFRVGDVEMCIYLADEDVDAIGFTLRTSALMNNPEAYFDEANLGDYDAFGVRFLILPLGMNPPVAAAQVEQQGNYVLWSVAKTTHGYVQVVDTTSAIQANSNDLGAATVSFLHSSLPGEGIYPTIAFAGAPAAAPTLAPGEQRSGAPGEVITSHDALQSGSFSATVTASRNAVVLLKASYDPGWQVTVDGVPATTEMIAPAYVGVEVAVGTHHVVFTYRGYSHYGLLFGIDLLVLLGFAFEPAAWRATRSLRRRREASPT